MTMDTMLQFGGGAVLMVGGWFMRELWSAVQKLKEDLSVLEKDMPLKYVQKDDYKTDINRILDTLNKIYEKLDSKADR
jgi:hypothetical protein